MTSPQEPSLSTNKNTPIEQKNQSIATVVARLKEAGLDIQRFIQLQSGSKAPVSHTQYRPQAIDDTYGVYAGDGLIFVDVDDYKQGVQKPSGFADLPATFTVRTPHGGTHLYYIVKEEIENHQQQWGEIRAENEYVVGPGSQLQDCSKDYHDCSQPPEGRYEIVKDHPIRSIDRGTLRSLLNTTPLQSHNGSEIPQQRKKLAPIGEEPDRETVEFSVEQRRQKMFNSKQGEKIKKLWKGQYRETGYEDRSTAEAVLVSYLGFWMGGNKQVVRNLMNEACEEYPGADVNGCRKWTEAREIYRQRTLQLATHFHDYQPKSSSDPYGERPEVSWVTEHLVVGALQDIEPARTADIVDHDLVDRQQRQIENCLDELIEQDLVEWERDGRNIYYRISYENRKTAN